MFLFAFASLVELGVLVFVLRWAFGQPHGMLDALVRVLVATAAGGLLAMWIVAASLVPQLNEEAKQDGGTFGAPSVSGARTIVDEVVASAPVSIDLAAAVGAGVGFFVALASIGSYRRVT